MTSDTRLPHLFRTEYRKIVSVLCRTFGLRDVETAEDIASETFLTAAQSWGIEGMPPNPTAWLYTVARNKAVNYLKRESILNTRVLSAYVNQHDVHADLRDDLPNEFFEDSQLRLMFALCHPSIPAEMQVALCLRLLCGFGVGEIADAFMTDRENISKRLLRAKERLRDQNLSLEIPSTEQLHGRIGPVLTTIYLLFNEGYYSSSGDDVLRKDLCLEAIRLTSMLIENRVTNVSEANALMALMCFHFSRFDSRTGEEGQIILYDDQDATAWNAEWISRGGFFLRHASGSEMITAFHIEAAIAYHHAAATPDKWPDILHLYDQLLQVRPSPVVAMNRAYALYKVAGPREAIASLEGVTLTDSHLYQALLGHLWISLDRDRARNHLIQAMNIAQSPAVKKALQRKLNEL
ncbi:MAG: sigma-70 family RNA polymerase sigma factor [Chryseolinea sp.]